MLLSDVPESALQHIVKHLARDSLRGLCPRAPLEAFPLAETSRLFRRVVSDALLSENGEWSTEIHMNVAPFLAWLRLGRGRLRHLSVPFTTGTNTLAIYNALGRCHLPLAKLVFSVPCNAYRSEHKLLRDFFLSVRGSLKSLSMAVSDELVGLVIEANLINVETLDVWGLGRDSGQLGLLIKLVKSLHPRGNASQSALRMLEMTYVSAEGRKMQNAGRALGRACPNVTNVIVGNEHLECVEISAVLGLVRCFKALRSLEIRSSTGEPAQLPIEHIRPFLNRDEFPHLSEISLDDFECNQFSVSSLAEESGSRLKKVKLNDRLTADEVRCLTLNCTSLTHLDIDLDSECDTVAALVELCERRVWLKALKVSTSSLCEPTTEETKHAWCEYYVLAVEACGPTLHEVKFDTWDWILPPGQVERILTHTGASLTHFGLSIHYHEPPVNHLLNVFEVATKHNAHLRHIEMHYVNSARRSVDDRRKINRALDLLEKSAARLDTAELRALYPDESDSK